MFKNPYPTFCPKSKHLATVHKRYWIHSQVPMEGNIILYYKILFWSISLASPGCLRADSLCEAWSCKKKKSIPFIWSCYFGQISVRKLLPEPHPKPEPKESSERGKTSYPFWNLFIEKRSGIKGRVEMDWPGGRWKPSLFFNVICIITGAVNPRAPGSTPRIALYWRFKKDELGRESGTSQGTVQALTWPAHSRLWPYALQPHN